MHLSRTMRWIALALAVTACTGVIDSSPGAGGGTGGSGSNTGGGDGPDAAMVAMADASTTTDAPAVACKTQVPANQLSSGNHNAGQDCMNGCHNHGFTLAGTLFTSSAGVTTIAGGTITVTDAGGHTFDVVSQLNGNFYTSTQVTFPVTVVASECPNTLAMSGSIPSGSGGCNRTGCHTTAAQGRIHLP